MADHKRRISEGKRRLIAPAVVGVALAGLIFAAFLLKRTPPPSPTPTPPPADAPVQQAVAPPLTRRDLVEASAGYAAAYAVGRPLTGKDPLVGRRLVLDLPFGCDGPQVGSGMAQAYFEYDAGARTITLVARPSDWSGLPQVQDRTQSDQQVQAEGFWVTRPWSYAETCPLRRDEPPPATPTPAAAPTLGLAQVFLTGDSRVLRHDGRPYEFKRRLSDDEAPPLTATFRLRIEARIAGFADGRAARCWSESADHRPICIVAVRFDKVAFDDQSGKELAKWEAGAS